MSTIWGYSLDRNDVQWLKLVKELGFTAVEICHKTNRAQLEGLVPLIRKEGLYISSLHNFCPLPDDSPSLRHESNYYRLSSIDEDERTLAVKWTKNTIDTAVDVKAPIVICHAGTVEIDPDPSPGLFELMLEGKEESEEFESLKRDILNKRKSVKGPYLESIVGSFREIMPYAEEKGIKVALETRYYPIEMPDFEEFDFIFRSVASDQLFYWHDVGHAEMNERLKIRSHLSFLDRYKHKLIGMHLHGMEGRRDHLAPFTGDMDITKVFPYINEDTIKVIEPQFASSEQMRDSMDKFLSLLS